jgi:hypothetical protein
MNRLSVWTICWAAALLAAGCALYGTNNDTGDCKVLADCIAGLPEDGCAGEFACLNGRCVYECGPRDSCSQDEDCVLVFDEDICCAADGLDDYISIRRDRIDEWNNRQECLGAACKPCFNCDDSHDNLCLSGECIKAVCQSDGNQAHCAVQHKDHTACDSNDECVKASADCCGCENGGSETALNSEFAEAFYNDIQRLCFGEDADCMTVYMCSERPAVCEQGHCMIHFETCDDCPEVWDPVCVITDDGSETIYNECQAECLGLAWWHTGECLAGEGYGCLQLCGVPCPEGQTCVGGGGNCEAPGPPPGNCVKLGSCLDAADCNGQPLPSDDCDGNWTCPDHECIWECD